MQKRQLLPMLLLLFVIFIIGFNDSALSSPVYSTGLEFSGAYDGWDPNTYVKLGKSFTEVPNTFEAWINVPQDVPDEVLIGTIIGNFPDDKCFTFGVRDTGSPRIYWNRGEVNVILNDHDVRTGEWIHFAVVRDETARRGTFTFYLNGEEVSVYFLGAGTSVISQEPPYIGSEPGASHTAGRFTGKIAELRVWNTVRTVDGIREFMNQELTGNEEGLIGYWKFDEGEGDILHDSSPYENHGTIVGAEWFTE